MGGGKQQKIILKKLSIYDHSWHSLSNSANKEMYSKEIYWEQKWY